MKALQRPVAVLSVVLLLVLVATGAFAGGEQEAEPAATRVAEEQPAQQGTQFVDPRIPDSWFGPPPLASALGIRSFRESPLLAEKVKKGQLPAVEERLPNDPPTIEPYEEVGTYGGTINRWSTSLGYLHAWSTMNPGTIRCTPDSRIIPWTVQGWEYSEDATELTFFLREGLKWSDGTPFTADDAVYWWEHERKNTDLNPVPPEKGNPPIENVVKIDKYTVKYQYLRSAPHEHFQHFRLYGLGPSEFLKQFHPDFVGMDNVKKMAADEGLDTWHAFYNQMKGSELHPEYTHTRPVLAPYHATVRTETSLLLERNPYYGFVDTEGNQLPYVDYIKYNLANSMEMVQTKIATGEVDHADFGANMLNIPLYKANAEKGGYRVLMYPRTYGGLFNVYVNISHKDPALRKVFSDLRFRQALSVAIDRETMNEKVFFGLGIPQQETIPSLSEYYKSEYAEPYSQYDPEQARQLLDEMGMKDIDGDGFRETPDGQNFEAVFHYALQSAGLNYFIPCAELTQQNWADVGIRVNLKEISYSLHGQRMSANEWDITNWIGAATTMFGKDGTGAIREYAPFYPNDNPWGDYAIWYQSQGESGLEPPEEVKKLREMGEVSLYGATEAERREAIDYLLKSQAENLWIIGTVSMGINPLIVSDKLRNVPEIGSWNWLQGFTLPYRPEQWFFSE